jgi:hypothetical protein
MLPLLFRCYAELIPLLGRKIPLLRGVGELARKSLKSQATVSTVAAVFC